MFKIRWLIALALAAVFSGILSYQASGFGKSGTIAQLQGFSLPDTQGMIHNIDEWTGKVLLINFWATWCPPCLKEIPQFMELQDSYGKQGLQFIGIAIEDVKAVREFSTKVGINYPVLVAGLSGFGLSAALGNRSDGLPFTVVVNRDGRIVHAHLGIFNLAQIQKSAIPLL
ncbi:MAG: TlpA family protein disulfide reductase [Methylococcaceae bacterium]|nr:TlpA family protein disulfide reductase [Methylococcaceae bacterium]